MKADVLKPENTEELAARLFVIDDPEILVRQTVEMTTITDGANY